jgi:hypothetical protein
MFPASVFQNPKRSGRVFRPNWAQTHAARSRGKGGRAALSVLLFMNNTDTEHMNNENPDPHHPDSPRRSPRGIRPALDSDDSLGRASGLSEEPPERLAITRQERVLILAGRIHELIPTHPVILSLDDDRGPFALRRIPELVWDDLAPTNLEFRYALAHARIHHRNRETL